MRGRRILLPARSNPPTELETIMPPSAIDHDAVIATLRRAPSLGIGKLLETEHRATGAILREALARERTRWPCTSISCGASKAAT
jgi:hypothetical protein